MVEKWLESVKAFVSFSETAMNSLAPTIYPSHIARACASLDESPQFKSMPDGYFRVLLRIIKKINLSSPFSPIFARRSVIAEESGKSIETVHRVIKWLEDQGLIEREQKARAGLRGSSSPLVPTKKLLEALLLSQAPQERAAMKHQQHSKHHDQVRQNQSSFVRVGKATIPADIAWLSTRNGLAPTGVLKLMSIAKKAKQRLSDVVAATAQYLEGLSGRALYAYIKALLSKDKDYRHVAQQAATEAETERANDYLKEKAEILEGRSFTNKDSSIQITVQGGVLMEIRQGRRAVRMMCKAFLNAIDDGRLRSSWPIACGQL